MNTPAFNAFLPLNYPSESSSRFIMHNAITGGYHVKHTIVNWRAFDTKKGLALLCDWEFALGVGVKMRFD